MGNYCSRIPRVSSYCAVRSTLEHRLATFRRKIPTRKSCKIGSRAAQKLQGRTDFSLRALAPTKPSVDGAKIARTDVDNFRESVSVVRMTQKEALHARRKLLRRLPVTEEILRGSLIERRVFRHKANCEKRASGEGHLLNVLTVTYPGGRTRQISLRPELVVQVRQWLENYKNLKEALEEICELNHQLLRPDEAR